MAERPFRNLPHIPKEYWGYMDFFSDDSSHKEPVVLADATSVLFPEGWTDEDADKWRKGHELQRPADITPVIVFSSSH